MPLYSIILVSCLFIACSRGQPDNSRLACLSIAMSDDGRIPLPGRSCFEINTAELTDAEKESLCLSDENTAANAVQSSRVAACPAGAVLSCADSSLSQPGITYFYDSLLQGRSCEEIETLIELLHNE